MVDIIQSIPKPQKDIKCQQLMEFRDVTKYGYLRKMPKSKSGRLFTSMLNRNWSQKFVVLYKGCIYLFRDEISNKFDRATSLFGFTEVLPVTKSNCEYQWVFNVYCALDSLEDKDEKSLCFAAPTQEIMKEWIKCFTTTLRYANAYLLQGLSQHEWSSSPGDPGLLARMPEITDEIKQRMRKSMRMIPHEIDVCDTDQGDSSDIASTDSGDESDTGSYTEIDDELFEAHHNRGMANANITKRPAVPVPEIQRFENRGSPVKKVQQNLKPLMSPASQRLCVMPPATSSNRTDDQVPIVPARQNLADPSRKPSSYTLPRMDSVGIPERPLPKPPAPSSCRSPPPPEMNFPLKPVVPSKPPKIHIIQAEVTVEKEPMISKMPPRPVENGTSQIPLKERMVPLPPLSNKKPNNSPHESKETLLDTRPAVKIPDRRPAGKSPDRRPVRNSPVRKIDANENITAEISYVVDDCFAENKQFDEDFVERCFWRDEPEQAQRLMSAIKEEGVFMIRSSKDALDYMTLIVCSSADGKLAIRKYKIIKSPDNSYSLHLDPSNNFNTIGNLLRHYHRNSLPNRDTKLTKPYTQL